MEKHQIESESGKISAETLKIYPWRSIGYLLGDLLISVCAGFAVAHILSNFQSIQALKLIRNTNEVIFISILIIFVILMAFLARFFYFSFFNKNASSRKQSSRRVFWTLFVLFFLIGFSISEQWVLDILRIDGACCYPTLEGFPEY